METLEAMKRKTIKFFIIFFIVNWATILLAEDVILLELYPQSRPYIYSVGFKYKDKDLWYQLEWVEFSDGKSVNVTCDVFYDSISKNFYCSKGGRIVIIPINGSYKLRFNEKVKQP